MVEEHLFTDRSTLLDILVQDCQHYLQEDLTGKGRATLLVSGGSTPAPLYQALSETDLDWDKVQVALVDERWVDRDHEASNEAFIQRTLLINNARMAPFTGMKTAAASARDGCDETEARYRALPQPYTVTILGMGSDGHTASLFPHAEGLPEALSEDNQQLTAAIMARPSPVTGANTERLTLTLTGLLKSRHLILLLTGEEKLAVFRSALTDGPVEDMPIRAVLRQNKVPVSLYWAP